MCGGTHFPAQKFIEVHGLSPRVRGNPFPNGSPALWRGSIPACAGEPRRPASRPRRRRVYPRVCGGTRASEERLQPGQGLSPRVRGNRSAPRRSGPPPGSIPACAGEPGCAWWRPCWTPVYPRVCGGTAQLAIAGNASKGLSPRVRGNPGAGRPIPSDTRSIPACAGEPGAAASTGGSSGVYPRVCGGTTPSGLPWPAVPGLSPRVRGNLIETHRDGVPHRSIPACAGEPPQSDCLRSAVGVYPRVCGGTTVRPSMTASFQGLSPRVRGNQWRNRHGGVSLQGLSPRVRGNPCPG